MMKSLISIKKLRLDVHLGCSLEEQAQTQPVDVNVKVQFLNPPEACRTDALADTVCYAELSKVLATVVAEKPYSTIEHLAHVCFEQTSRILKNHNLEIEIHKLHPPINLPTNGVTFVLSNLQ